MPWPAPSPAYQDLAQRGCVVRAVQRKAAKVSNETLSAEGRVRLDSAMDEVLRYPRDTPLIIEGYAVGATRDVRFRGRRTARGRSVSTYRALWLAAKPRRYHALGELAINGPDGAEWDGVSLAAWVDRRALRSEAERRCTRRSVRCHARAIGWSSVKRRTLIGHSCVPDFLLHPCK